MRCGLAVSGTGQTGQSDAIHAPQACAGMVVQIDHANGLVDGRGLRDLVLPQRLAHDVEPATERRIAEVAYAFAGLAGADD